MLQKRYAFILALLIAGTLGLTGCAGPQLPADQLKNYALLLPRQNSSIVAEVDDRNTGLALAGKAINIPPGRHKIETESCNGGTSSCVSNIYFFNVEAGLAYVFRGPDTVEVFDRFRLKGEHLGYLHQEGGRQFLSDQAFAAVQQEKQEQANNVQIAVMAQRKRNLSVVRKIGSRICQDVGGGVIDVGYVEAMTEEKVQIRISGAFMKGRPNLRPGDFSPMIFWDSPMNWDLCE